MKAMISQPMNGIDGHEIVSAREKAIKFITKAGYEFATSLFIGEEFDKDNLVNDGVVSIPLNLLGRALQVMSTCDAVYFCRGWEKARGCKIEHEAAVAYGLTIIYEDGGSI